MFRQIVLLTALSLIVLCPGNTDPEGGLLSTIDPPNEDLMPNILQPLQVERLVGSYSTANNGYGAFFLDLHRDGTFACWLTGCFGPSPVLSGKWSLSHHRLHDTGRR